MRITVIGLGYVGSVSAACLAEIGHSVCGVDIDPAKVARFNEGCASIIEAGLDELIAAHVRSGRLRATTDLTEALADAEVAMIAVGTPSQPGGAPDLRPLTAVCDGIHQGLGARRATRPLLVVVRSTVPPGTLAQLVTERVGGGRYRAGADFHVCSNPEFLREGTAVEDFMHQTLTVVGASHPEAFATMAALYAPLGVEITRTEIEASELVKYASNAYHALKVCFGNEIGTLAAALGVDGREVMEIFCHDRVLNISPVYLIPGYSYGGSCLPKDVRALNRVALDLDIGTPLLASITPSNQAHLLRGLKTIEALGKRRIGLFGLAFKPGTADLRESPMLHLLERLQARRYQVLVHDEEVAAALDSGFYEPTLACRLQGCLRDLNEVVAHAEVAVIGKRVSIYDGLDRQLEDGVELYDLVGQYRHAPGGRGYQGICWDQPRRHPDAELIEREPVAATRRTEQPIKGVASPAPAAAAMRGSRAW